MTNSKSGPRALSNEERSGPITDRPPLAIDRDVAMIHDKLDNLIPESREQKVFREKTTTTLVAIHKRLDSHEEILFKILASVQRAETTIAFLSKPSGRREDSWTNEIAQEAARRGLGFEAGERIEKAKRRAAVWKWADRGIKALGALVLAYIAVRLGLR